MDRHVTFFYAPHSRASCTLALLEELGADYDIHVLDLKKGTQREPAYLAINPMGKVPAIRHGEMVVTETAAICAYLADAFPEAGLAPPPRNRLRGAYYRWMFFGAGPLDGAVVNAALGVVVPEGKERMAGYGSLAATLDTLDGAVSRGDYLVGDGFTAADLYVGSQLWWGMMFGMIEKRPAFEAYVGRVNARPAAARAREIDDALIAAAPNG